MGISSTTNRVVYQGDGSSATFAFQYEFHAPADLDVHIWNSSRIVATSTKVLNSDYTISGVADAQNRYTNGANVIFNSSPAVGDYIVIVRDPSPTNPFNIKYNQVIPNAELVKALDRLTIIEQRLSEYIGRGIRLSDAYPLTLDATLPERLPAGGPVIIGSGGVTIEIGVVALRGTTAATYFGILPIENGGTGLDLSLLDGILYSPGNNTTVERIVDGGQDVPLVGVAGSSAPIFTPLNIVSGSSTVGILPQFKGGTGTASSFPLSGILFQESSTTVGFVPSTTPGFVLTSNGSSAPSYQAFAASLINSGTISVAFGGTGTSTSYIQHGVVFASSATQMANTDAGGLDLPLVGNGAAAPGFRALNVASGSTLSGIMRQINGGTGTASSFPQYGVVYQGASDAYGVVPSAAQGLVLTSNGSSAPSFIFIPSSPVIPTTTTATTTITNSIPKVILSSSSYNINLYDAVGNGGREIDFIRTDSTYANPINIVGSGAQTIGTSGTSFPIYTVGETLTLFSDNVNWQVKLHRAETEWIDGGEIVITTSSLIQPAKGTRTRDKFFWKRLGDTVYSRIEYFQTASGSSGLGHYMITLPTGLIFDTTVQVYTGPLVPGGGAIEANAYALGNGTIMETGAGDGDLWIIPFNSSKFRVFMYDKYTSSDAWDNDYFDLSVASTGFAMEFKAKILNWKQ